METNLINNFISLALTMLFIGPSLAQEVDNMEEKAIEENPVVELHGALRYNFRIQSWNKDQIKRGGDFSCDMLAFSPKATYKGLTLATEYRLYSNSRFLRKGDITYDFNSKDKLVIGLTQVPFGIQTYFSHGYWLSMGYYMGLEDNYDMGVKYMHAQENLEYQVAFFKNSENTGATEFDRYSFDLVDGFKEVNQLNGKIIYKINGDFKQKIGVSGEYGGLLNSKTNQMGDHSSFAVHYEGTKGNFNVRLQAITFSNNPEGTDAKTLNLGGYGYKYSIANKGQLYQAGLAYTFPVESKVFDYFQLYNDYNYFDKTEKSFNDAFTNTIGLLIATGNIYTYAEYTSSKNQPWLTKEGSFGKGNDEVQSMFNINIGYYF